jgi:hypothetical protein
MRLKTRREVARLAAEGLGPEDIAARLGCRPASVARVLEGLDRPGVAHVEEDPRPAAGSPSLSDVASGTRQSLLDSAKNLREHVTQVGERLKRLLAEDNAPASAVQATAVTLGIILDKQAAVLHQLRALESEAAESIEMAFTIIEEFPDGTRRVLGQPPELERLGVVGFRVPDPRDGN